MSELWLQSYVSAHSPACPRCRRPITQLTTTACPHCQAQLALGLGAPRSYSLLWAMTLTALGALAGASLFFTSLALRIGIFRLPSSPPQGKYIVLAQLFLAPPSLVALFITWRGRRRFFTFRTRYQFLLFTLTALLALANLALLAAYIH